MIFKKTGRRKMGRRREWRRGRKRRRRQKASGFQALPSSDNGAVCGAPPCSDPLSYIHYFIPSSIIELSGLDDQGWEP